MRVLLDENLPRQLKRHFSADVEVLTVQERGWSGIKNWSCSGWQLGNSTCSSRWTEVSSSSRISRAWP